MNPVTYTMLDLKGLDLASVKGQSYPGLYNSIYAAMNRCQEIILCNWFVAGILIPPTYCLLEIDELNVISINDKVFIYPDDTIEIPDMGTNPRILELSITQNGEYVVPVDYDGFNPVEVNVPPYIPVISSLSITENGTYIAPEGVDGYSPVHVNIPGVTQGFELYGAGFSGGTQTFTGKIDNVYLSCCFHDNMYPDYVLNGVTERFSASCAGHGSGLIYATTKAVSNNTPVGLNALFEHLGSVLQSRHYDSGSYMSVVGGWVGYPTGAEIYENAVPNVSQNTIVMNSAHQKLLIFIAASAVGLTGTSVEINGIPFNITNMGTRYDSVYSAYAAVEINNNADTTITVTFPSVCYNYVSIIGIDN